MKVLIKQKILLSTQKAKMTASTVVIVMGVVAAEAVT